MSKKIPRPRRSAAFDTRTRTTKTKKGKIRGFERKHPAKKFDA